MKCPFYVKCHASLLIKLAHEREINEAMSEAYNMMVSHFQGLIHNEDLEIIALQRQVDFLKNLLQSSTAGQKLLSGYRSTKYHENVHHCGDCQNIIAVYSERKAQHHCTAYTHRVDCKRGTCSHFVKK